MPYPDWIEGKQQFTRTEQIASIVDLSGTGLQDIKLFNSSGEIISGRFTIYKFPDEFYRDDYLQIYIDGILVQRLSWVESCYLEVGSWVSPILPGYYDYGGMGIMNISGLVSFFSSLEFKYYKTSFGTIRTYLELSIGIY